jgi:membrane-bound lytic murein transglycosylase F
MIILACAGMVTCSTLPPLLTQIQMLGELRVVTRNSPISHFIGPDGPVGPEYELVRGLADRLGVSLSIYTPASFDETLEELTSRRAHIAAAGLSVTPERLLRVEFGPAYDSVRPQLIRRLNGMVAASIEDIQDARVEVLAGSSHAHRLRELQQLHPELQWEEIGGADVDELLARLAAEDSDFTVVNSNEFMVARHLYPELRTAFDLGDEERVAWALPRQPGDRSLLEAVHSYFAEIEAEGALAAIFRRYLEPAETYDYVSTRAFVDHFNRRLPRYREWFIEAARESGLDWRLLAAVGYQESHWNPAAVSPTGVRGIMMLTSNTASAMEVTDRVDPYQSIMGGARYLALQRERIPERIGEPDRTWLALAAYNIGSGHLEDGRIITEMNGADPDSWEDVRAHLPLLTQRQWYSRVRRGAARGWQPVHYVDNVQRYYHILQWMTAGESWQQPDEGVDEDAYDEPAEDDDPSDEYTPQGTVAHTPAR